jgi:hypothetical protein
MSCTARDLARELRYYQCLEDEIPWSEVHSQYTRSGDVLADGRVCNRIAETSIINAPLNHSIDA